MGGDLGEVVIRNLGGVWKMGGNPDGTSRVILRSQGIQMFPLEKVDQCLADAMTNPSACPVIVE